MRELTVGYESDPTAILATTFPVQGTDLVACRGIHFAALCQHHLLPVSGTVSVSYRPVERVVGLSKIARLVDCLARRLTLQERLTSEIADALDACLKPAGVLVEVEGQHGCVCCRGVRQDQMVVVTRARRGCEL
jgi:GTP cyclohydrolase I